MKRMVVRGFIGLLLAAAGGALEAQDVPPFRVDFDRLVLLAGGEGVGAEREVTPGDEILRTRIGYAAAARLDGPISLVLAGVPVDLPAGAFMIEGTPRGATRERVGRGARIFCSSPQGAVPKDPNGNRSERRLDDSVLPCLVDANGDHSFESAFLIGTRRPADRIIAPISAGAAYSEVPNVPLPDSEAWITFERGAALQGPVLEFHVHLFGRAPAIRGVRVPVDDDERFFPIERTVRRSAYPHTIAFADAEVAILGYTAEGRRLQIRVDRPFATAPMKLDLMGPNIIFIYH